MHRVQELVQLHRQSLSGRQIARRLRMGRNTVRLYSEALAAAGLLDGPADELPDEEALREVVGPLEAVSRPAHERSSVELWAPDIDRLLKKDCSARAIHDWLRLERPGFAGSYDAVKRYVRRARERAPVEADDVVIPVQTEPGEVAQVDFGFLGRLRDPSTGVSRRAWVFVMVLGHSRHMFAEVVFDQREATWQRLHAAAFAWFGGVPRVVVPDNLKAAVIRAAFTSSDEGLLHRGYVELARHYGFQVDPTPPRSPEKKGKVEAGVKYVVRNFWRPRQGVLTDLEAVRSELPRWLLEVAGQRLHGATRQRPLEVFDTVERPALLPLPTVAWRPVSWRTCKVHRDAHVQVERARYSVPWRLCGQDVTVRLVGQTVEIHQLVGGRLATHVRQPAGRRSTLPGHLPAEREDFAQRSPAWWQRRAEQIGPQTAALVDEVLAADTVQHPLRKVQGIVTALAKVEPDRAEAAARRARHFGNLSVGAVQRILREGLDLVPLLEDPGPTEHGRLDRPRFARPPAFFTPRPVPEA